MKHLVLLLGLFLLLSCTKKQEQIELGYRDAPVKSEKRLRFAIHPLHNPTKLEEVFGPLIVYLNKNTKSAVFELEASANYPAFEEKLKARQIDFALPNPYQTLKAVDSGYKIFAKMGDDKNFRGLILVRKDSGIKSFSDLKGKAISYPAATALAATMMPQYFLFKNGVKLFSEAKSLYVGSQESSIMSVYLKTSQAGATWPPPWNAFVQNNPEKAKELEVMWLTETLPNNGLVARDDISPELVEQVKKSLLSLHESDEGKVILARIGLSKFESATESTYQPVKEFLEKFRREVRDPEKEL